MFLHRKTKSELQKDVKTPLVLLPSPVSLLSAPIPLSLSCLPSSPCLSPVWRPPNCLSPVLLLPLSLTSFSGERGNTYLTGKREDTYLLETCYPRLELLRLKILPPTSVQVLPHTSSGKVARGLSPSDRIYCQALPWRHFSHPCFSQAKRHPTQDEHDGISTCTTLPYPSLRYLYVASTQNPSRCFLTTPSYCFPVGSLLN